MIKHGFVERNGKRQGAAPSKHCVLPGTGVFRHGGRAALAFGTCLASLAIAHSIAGNATADFEFFGMVAHVNLIELSEDQIVRNVFRNQQSVAAARKHAENGLDVQIEFVALIGDLTDEQRAKIQLAGRGDIHRFFDDFGSLLRSAPLGQIPQQQWQNFWQKIQPLQIRYQAGLHGSESLFRKTIPSALDVGQMARFEKIEQERRRRHYRAIVEAALAAIDGNIPLTAKQRQEVIKVVMEKTKPPRAYGQSYYQYHIVLYQMAKIEKDLKPLFLENEWKVMQGMLQQGRGMEHMFRHIAGVELE